MKPFIFKQFAISQSEAVFRVGTDAVILGALANVQGIENILEVGSGTGIISLMAAQRNPSAAVDAIDINADAAQLTEKNFASSPFAERLRAYRENFESYRPEKQYDLVLSNPPYFPENSSPKDVLARQQKTLTFKSLAMNAARLLKSSGRLTVIIPFDSTEYFERECLNTGLHLQNQTTVYGIKGTKPKRAVLVFGFLKLPLKESKLIIEESPRKFSEEYLKLTADFHPFIRNLSGEH